MAMAIPPSDMMLALTPIIRKGMKATSTATGMVTSGTIALGMCQRKARITSATVIMISITVSLSVSIDRTMSSERS